MCSASNLTVLPEFPSNDTVTTLSVHRSEIRVLNDTSFASLRELTVIDFSNNHLERIADGTFAELTKLNVLILRRNVIRELTDRTFGGLDKLTFLDLSYNHLSSLPDNCFLQLKSLRILDLARNRIEDTPFQTFSGLGGLKTLNLSRNTFKYLEPKVFEPLVSLETLMLEDSSVDHIPANAFTSLVALKRLSLNGNKLIDFDEKAFRNTFDPTSKEVPLEKLSLRGTQLAQLPVLTLQTLTRLQSLDISNTSITVVESASFSQLGQLRNLTIDSCPSLRNISTGAFSGLHNLENLIITNNPVLQEIGWGVFQNLSSLKFLDVSHNRLEVFRASMAHWSEIALVDLRFNRLRCDCHTRWMMDLLSDPFNVTVHPTSALSSDATWSGDTDSGSKYLPSTTTITTSSLTRQINCTAPSRLQNTPLSALTPADFTCPTFQDVTSNKDSDKNRFKVGIIAASIASVLLVAFALFIKFRNRICIKCRRQYRYKAYHSNGFKGADGMEMEDTQFEDLDSDAFETQMK